MRLSCCLTIFLIASVPLTASFSIKSVFETLEILKLALDILPKILDISAVVEKEFIFKKLDDVNIRLAEIDNHLDEIDRQFGTINRLLKELPKKVVLEFTLRDVRTYMIFVDEYFSTMKNYVLDYAKYENSTMIDFGDSVVSHRTNSVYYLARLTFKHVTNEEFLRYLSSRFDPYTADSAFCDARRSPQQAFLKFLNEMIMFNAKSYVLMHAGYMFKKIYGKGNFTREFSDAHKVFLKRHNNLLVIMQPYIEKASREEWRCDPAKHVEGETYLQITNFLHGYILNKRSLNSKGSCSMECDTLTYTKTHDCYGHPWCTNTKQIACPKALNCRYIDSKLEVCLKKMPESGRRYGYIAGNGNTYGRRDDCDIKRDEIHNLKTYIFWIIYRCSFCFCTCEEQEEKFSDRFINLRMASSNIGRNKVITGVRFVRQNRIIHLQVQEGKLIKHGRIDADTVRWVPIDTNFKITGKYIPGVDYHSLSWEKRTFDLADVVTKDTTSVVTGVKFYIEGSQVRLEVLTTPFNFTSGKLLHHTQKAIPKNSRYSKELRLHEPDVPTRVDTWSPPIFTTDQHVKFTHTDLKKDAAQTTVPFFDSQEVTPAMPVPLSGIGIFHKGRRGSGGFVTARIFTYDFSPHFPLLSLRSGQVKSSVKRPGRH